MNSRGREPTVPSQNTFDPAGVAHSLNIPPWVCTHGYSYLTVSRSGGYRKGMTVAAPWHGPAFPVLSARADLPRMSTLHGLLSLAGAGALDGRRDRAARGFSGAGRTPVHPELHAPDAGSPGTGLAGKARRRVCFSGRQRLRRSSRETAAVSGFSESVAASRGGEPVPGHPANPRRRGIRGTRGAGDGTHDGGGAGSFARPAVTGASGRAAGD